MPYSPAGNGTNSASLSHLASVYYDRTALSALRKKFMFWKGVDTRTLPKKNGKTIQFYRYSQLGANTTPSDEGNAGGQSLQMTSSTVSATVSQYTDFISFSDLLVDTAIDGDIVAVGADMLGYRAGLTVDTILRNEVDSNATSIDVSLLGDYFTGGDVANIRTRFAGLDIRPFEDGLYRGIIHPYSAYDFIHDPQVGGFLDVTKQHPSTENHGIFTSMEDRGFIGTWSGVQLWESTNTTLVSGSPNKYRCYFFGMEGLGAIDLAGRGPTRTSDQNAQKFQINVIQESKPSIANIEGKIRAAVSYNFVFVAKTLDTNPYRMRKIDAPNSLGL
jgi:N4-gp56 family major capsid protein